MFKLRARKEKNQSTNNLASNKQSVKGGINVDVNVVDPKQTYEDKILQTVIDHLHRQEVRFDEKFDTLFKKIGNIEKKQIKTNNEVEKVKTGLHIYVQGNGSKPPIKEAVKIAMGFE